MPVVFRFALLLSMFLSLPDLLLADPQGRIRVIDGDTWDVGGVRVRLFGIDAPEADQTCTDSDGIDWPCGGWVSREVRKRYQGKTARCVEVATDRYGRSVSKCSVNGRDAGRDLVSDGLAFAYRRYSMDYDLDEKAAAVNGRGLHGSKVQAPAAWRAQKRRKASGAPAGGCVIKGNISSRGVRIYHLPGQEHYDRTRISPGKGERWFCSQAEARAAGWRKARR